MDAENELGMRIEVRLEPQRLLVVGDHGLFDKHVLAGFESAHDSVEVLVVGRAQRDGIDTRQQLIQACRHRDSDFAHGFDVKRHDLRDIPVPSKPADVSPPGATDPYDTYSQLLHRSTLLSPIAQSLQVPRSQFTSSLEQRYRECQRSPSHGVRGPVAPARENDVVARVDAGKPYQGIENLEHSHQ
jgi:hypothetical protein